MTIDIEWYRYQTLSDSAKLRAPEVQWLSAAVGEACMDELKQPYI